MKSIIRQILIAFVLISIIYESQCHRDHTRGRLSRTIEKINKSRDYEDEINIDIGRDFDMECIKDLFKYPQNNKMILNQVEEIIFIVTAGMKCSKDDKLFEAIFDEYVHSGLERRFSCIRWYLQQLEPSSKLVENFEIDEADLIECKKRFPVNQIVDLQLQIESILGPLNVYTCGAVSENGANDLLKFMGKGAVIKYGNISEELRKSEKEKLKEYLKDISIRTVNCVIKRFEDDPQAFLINDTLNYYYKKDLVPIDQDQVDDLENDYYKRLSKLEDVIDQNCVKEKLNLPENGNKALLEVEATILLASARSKCIKVDPIEFSELFIDFSIQRDQSARHFSCAQYKLLKIEPTSKLAMNYIKDESDERFCKYQDTSLHPFIVRNIYEDYVVGKLNETTCGVLTEEIVDMITLKITLLSYEKDKDVKISEINDLYKYAINKLHKLADCILARIS